MTSNRATGRTLALAIPVLLLLAACGVESPAPERGAAVAPEESREVASELVGPYLGQTPPGETPRLFAPGVVSTGMYERDTTLTPDGREFYFSVVLGNHEHSVIMVTRVEKGRWTTPAVAPFSGRYRDLEPFVTPDGRRLFFASHRPVEPDGRPGEEADIWFVERRAADGGTGTWGQPERLGPPVNTEGPEFFPSVTRDGTLYFTRDFEGGASAIFRSRQVDGAYDEPQRLGPQVNSTRAQFNGYISPDESYLIYGAYGRDDSFGGVDYYVSFRDADDGWTGPIHLDERFNTASSSEYSPYVTPDGRYFFFMATRSRLADLADAPPRTAADLRRIHDNPGNGLPDIYWVDAGFLEALRP